MIPFYWDKTVTVFTPEYNEQTGLAEWERTVFSNSYYAPTSASSFKSDDVWRENRTTCRIPQIDVHIVPGGSVVFFGKIEEDIPSGKSANELKERYSEHFTVKSSTTNEYPIEHIHLTGA